MVFYWNTTATMGKVKLRSKETSLEVNSYCSLFLPTQLIHNLLFVFQIIQLSQMMWLVLLRWILKTAKEAGNFQTRNRRFKATKYGTIRTYLLFQNLRSDNMESISKILTSLIFWNKINILKFYLKQTNMNIKDQLLTF